MDFLTYFVWILLAIYTVPLLVLPIINLRERLNNTAKKAIGQSVIVPMRNEAQHVERLFQEFNAQSGNQIFEVIFIDDHSDDETLHLLKSHSISARFSHKILTLSEGMGKKAALREGLAASQYAHCITVDADTYRNAHWLECISNGSEAEMLILPVWMKPIDKSFLSMLQVVEQQFLQSLSYFSAKMGFPVLCSGANLSFRKPEKYLINNHASGDDIFLLEQIILDKGQIDFLNEPEAAVFTTTSANWSAFLHQRMRWQSKNFLYRAKRFYVFGLWAMCGLLAVLLCLLLTILQWCSPITFLSIVAIKGFAETMFIFNGLKALKVKQTNILHQHIDETGNFQIFFYLILYNAIAWIVLLCGIFRKPSWKGRKV